MFTTFVDWRILAGMEEEAEPMHDSLDHLLTPEESATVAATVEENGDEQDTAQSEEVAEDDDDGYEEEEEEELLEVITLKRLGVFTRPIIIVNQDGYYDPLVTMLEKAISEKFMGEQHRDIWSVVDRVDRVLEAIAHAPPWQSDAIKRAKA